jgi:hypothetical protein
MKLAVAHSLDPDTEQAAEELIGSVRTQLGDARPSAGLIYTAMDFDHATLIARLSAAFEGLTLIGCTTDGEVSDCSGFNEDSVVLILFASEQITIRAGLGRQVSTDPLAAARQAVAMATRPGDPTPRLCVALPDGLSVSGNAVTNALQSVLGDGVTLVGGTAADQRQFDACWLLYDGKIFKDALPLLLFYGPLSVGVGQDSGWTPVGQKARVTEATANVVTRIGDQTALEFYRSYFGTHVIPDPEYPLVVYEADRETAYIRAPLVVNLETGALQFAGDVPVGASVRIAEASREDIIEACAQSVRAAFQALGARQPDGALVFSCAARRMVLGTRALQEIQTLQKNCPRPMPIGGFYCYGEIAPVRPGEAAQFHNETFITVLLAED